jgi:hypothetical protein
MVILLAVKISPHTVNSMSAYRTLYSDAAKLTHHSFTTTVRLIAGFGGLFAFCLFVWLALQELPRPALARGEFQLDHDDRGVIIVKPRAVERLAEAAARESSQVAAATGRLGDGELNLSVEAARARTAAEALRDTQRRVIRQLEQHELPSVPVNVTLTGYLQRTRRDGT